jgi:peptide/nickel transport system substrate-binding protein
VEPQETLPGRSELSRRHLLAAAGLGASSYVFLAACGGSDSSGSSGGGDGGGGEQTVTVATASFYGEKFDPIITSGWDKILACMFECPWRLDDNGSVVAGIVTDWETSADGMAWTLHMRDDVVFHDGTKATSEDLAYAYERAVTSPDTGADWEGILGKHPKIDIVDDTTVVVHTIVPSSVFMGLSTILLGIWIVPKAYIESKGVKYFEDHPIGTGPYKFDSLESGTSITFTAVDYKHWRIQPDFDTVKIRLIPNSSTAIAELRSGGVDVINVAPQQFKELESAGFSVIDVEFAQIYLPIIGAYDPSIAGQPMADVNVRHALSLAINRQEIIDTILQGDGEIPGPIRVGLSMPDVTPDLRSKWEAWCKDNLVYDPDQAKQMIADAGFPDGFKLDFWYEQDQTVGYLQDLAQVIASYWHDIGVDVSIQVITEEVWGSVGNPATTKKAVGKILMGSTSLPKASAVENTSSVYRPTEAFDLFYNAPQAAQYDALFDKAWGELDPNKVAGYLDQMLVVEMDSWTGIPLVQVPAPSAFSPRVDPYVPKLSFGLGDTYAAWKYAGD